MGFILLKQWGSLGKEGVLMAYFTFFFPTSGERPSLRGPRSELRLSPLLGQQQV